ncbi:MAG: dihydropteroate synthase, partial [Actinomycetes bacterium]
LWGVAAELGVGWIAMHMAGTPQTMQDHPRYGDVVDEVRAFLAERAAQASRAGVAPLWVDPGIGFGKTTRHNLELLARLDALVDDGVPVVMGTSRKRFIGELLARSDSGELRPVAPTTTRELAADVDPVPTEDRLLGSLSSAVWAMIHGARMVRVHDVGATVVAERVLRTGSVTSGR